MCKQRQYGVSGSLRIDSHNRPSNPAQLTAQELQQVEFGFFSDCCQVVLIEQLVANQKTTQLYFQFISVIFVLPNMSG